MVCDNCGQKEILYYHRKKEEQDVKCCPFCDGLSILSKEDSIKISEKQYQFINEIVNARLKNFDQMSLLYWTLAYREKLYSQFITEVPYFKLNELLSINVLIKKVMHSNEESGNEKANDANTKEMISFFAILVKIKEYQSLIEEDFGYFIAKNDYDLDKIQSQELFSNFEFVYDEDWMIVVESFDQNLIMTDEAGEKYLEKYSDEYEDVKNNYIPEKMNTPEEYIRNIYPLLQSFRVGLTKNRLFAEMFDFDYLENKKVLIELFEKISNYFPFSQGLLTFNDKIDFQNFLSSEFKDLNQEKLYNGLVYSKNNQEIFPLFVEVDNRVIISRFFINLIGIFYYSFYYNTVFHRETQLLSDKFEKMDVPNKFHENGFNVRINMEKKNALEIDTIAWNNNTLYVVESKIWDTKSFFEHRRVHNQRERDLKGIVDGFKYTKEKPKIIPNLTDKVDYVKNTIGQILPDYEENDNFPDYADIDFNNITEFVGIVVTKSYPPIKEYKNVKMIGFREIDNFLR